MSDKPDETGTGIPDLDRPRGVLTGSDRELLFGMKEYDSEQALRNARYRVREHIRESLLDIFHISGNLEQEELAQILSRQSDVEDEKNWPRFALESGLVGLAVRIIYEEYNFSKDSGFEERLEGTFAGAIVSGYEGATDGEIVTDVDIDITIEVENTDEDMVRNLVFGQPDMHTVLSYIHNGDATLLYEKLVEHDEVINVADEENGPVGPDHPLFSVYVSDEDTS